MNDEKQFLSKRQVAALLNLSIYTIDSWVSQRREIAFHRFGRRVMFDVRDVQAWVEKHRVNPR